MLSLKTWVKLGAGGQLPSAAKKRVSISRAEDAKWLKIF